MMRCALEAEAQLRCVAARTVLKAASADKAAKSAAGKFLLRWNIVIFSVQYIAWLYVWIRIQTAAVASRRGTSLTTQLSAH